MTNPDALGLLIGWEAHTCGLFGNLAGSVEADEGGDQDLAADVTLSGTIVNEPPHADAGQDQLVECTSVEVTL